MAEYTIESTLDQRLAAHRTVAWRHGIIGGLLAGVIMALFLMVSTALTGDGFLLPLELIGSIWYGAVTTGVGVMLIGLATHLVVASAFGALWAYAFSWVRVEPIISGLIFGAALWALMQYLVLPFLGSFLLGTFSLPDAAAWMLYDGYAVNGFRLWMTLGGYLAFGATLGVFEQLAHRRRV